jgi:hypothetical protein
MNDRETLIGNAAPMGHTSVPIGSTPQAQSQQQQQQPGFSADTEPQSIFKQSSHPKVLFFHLFFRTAAVATFIFSMFTSDFVIPFVLVILFSAFDFWTVKNVSGRKLVGLRYWNDVKEDGTSVWIFESRNPNAGVQINQNDSRVFWWSLYLFPVIWVVFGIVELIGLKITWLPAVFMCFSLTFANLAGYIRCDRDAKQKLQSAIGNRVQQGLLNSLFSRFT